MILRQRLGVELAVLDGMALAYLKSGNKVAAGLNVMLPVRLTNLV
jgi:hypothetical protein